MRHDVDPTDHMCELGAQWLPGGVQSVARNGVQGSARGLKSDSEGGSEGGAKSGALTVQNGAQQAEIPRRTDAHEKTQPLSGCVLTTDTTIPYALVQIPQVEMIGLEPTTSCLQSRRSPN